MAFGCLALGGACLIYYWFGTVTAGAVVNTASAFGAPATVSEGVSSRLAFSAATAFLAVGVMSLIAFVRMARVEEDQIRARFHGHARPKRFEETRRKRMLPWILLFVAAGGAGYLLSHYVAMTLCLDGGGRWDRQQQSCTYTPRK